VIHLQNGSLWDQAKFLDQTIIEIRPQQPINKSGAPVVGMVNTFLDFSADRIRSLKQRGYNDAKQTLEPIVATLDSSRQQRQQTQSFVHSTESLLGSTEQLLHDQPLL
jgi:NTE family protein